VHNSTGYTLNGFYFLLAFSADIVSSSGTNSSSSKQQQQQQQQIY
jgi:hypothetical protein